MKVVHVAMIHPDDETNQADFEDETHRRTETENVVGQTDVEHHRDGDNRREERETVEEHTRDTRTDDDAPNHCHTTHHGHGVVLNFSVLVGLVEHLHLPRNPDNHRMSRKNQQHGHDKRHNYAWQP